MLKKILEANNGQPDHMHILFQNTGREMEQTLQFVKDCGDKWGCKITWLEYTPEKPLFKVVDFNTASRNGEPFEALIKRRKYVPNVVTRYCTEELKYKTSKRYLRTIGIKEYYSYIGFRADESSRVQKIDHGKRKEKVKTPLYFDGVTRDTVQDFWSNEAGFDLVLNSVKGKTALGNCDGCFLKSEKILAHLCKHYPERAEWWDRMEKQTGATFNKDFSISDLIKCVSDQFDLLDNVGGFCESKHGVCETY